MIVPEPVPPFATARSGRPSKLTSAIAIEWGKTPVPNATGAEKCRSALADAVRARSSTGVARRVCSLAAYVGLFPRVLQEVIWGSDPAARRCDNYWELPE